jgi:uncharacterized protein YkwD
MMLGMALQQRGWRRLAAALAVVLALVPITSARADTGDESTPVVHVQAQRSVAVDDAVRVHVLRMSSAKPVTIRWGDGATTQVRSECTARQAINHPRLCAVTAEHSYRSAGVFRIVVSRTPQVAYRAVLRVAKTVASAPAQPSASQWRLDMLSQVNALRQKAGVASLELCEPLQGTAQDYATLMASTDYYGHVGPDGSEPWDRMAAHGYAWHGAGENIAAGFDDVAAVMAAWRESPGHLANIMNPSFTHVGFGQAANPGSTSENYWVQNFGYGGNCSNSG